MTKTERLLRDIDDILYTNEINTTTSVGGSYNTPNAFGKENDYYEYDDEEGEDYKEYSLEEDNNFKEYNIKSKYSQLNSLYNKLLKENEMLDTEIIENNPIKQISEAMKDIKYNLSDITKNIKTVETLKLENGLSKDDFWKTTLRDIDNINQQVLQLTKTIRNINS